MYCWDELFLDSNECFLRTTLQWAHRQLIATMHNSPWRIKAWVRGNEYIDGLLQERRNSSALAMELHLSCSNPSIYPHGVSNVSIGLRRTRSAYAYNAHQVRICNHRFEHINFPFGEQSLNYINYSCNICNHCHKPFVYCLSTTPDEIYVAVSTNINPH